MSWYMTERRIVQPQRMNIQFDALIFTNIINILNLFIGHIYDPIVDIRWNNSYIMND